MFYERLSLEVGAEKAGWNVIESAAMRGASGVVHKFTFLASDGSSTCGFDAYDSITELHVLRSYIKKVDTGISVALVCLRGTSTEKARSLAEEYGMKILNEQDVESFFVNRIIEMENQSGTRSDALRESGLERTGNGSRVQANLTCGSWSR